MQRHPLPLPVSGEPWLPVSRRRNHNSAGDLTDAIIAGVGKIDRSISTKCDTTGYIQGGRRSWETIAAVPESSRTCDCKQTVLDCRQFANSKSSRIRNEQIAILVESNL